MVKNKKNILFIILGIIIFIIYSIVLVNVVKKDSHDKILYKYYEDSLIEINNSEESNIKAISNIIDDTRSLAILLTSNITQSKLANIEINYYDSENNVKKNEEFKLLIKNNDAVLGISKLPILDDGYAGNIKINITYENIEVDDSFNQNINFNNTIKENENGLLKLEFSWQNNLDKDIKELSGFIVLVKDNKIIAYNSFFEENIMRNGYVNFTRDFYSNNVKLSEYDEIKSLIQYISYQ